MDLIFASLRLWRRRSPCVQPLPDGLGGFLTVNFEQFVVKGSVTLQDLIVFGIEDFKFLERLGIFGLSAGGYVIAVHLFILGVPKLDPFGKNVGEYITRPRFSSFNRFEAGVMMLLHALPTLGQATLEYLDPADDGLFS
jgi:hypothetical protein